MRKSLFILFVMLNVVVAASVQAQDQKAGVVQAMRSDGFPLEAEILSRYVELEMSPQWWTIMQDPGEARGARKSLRIVASNMIALANNMGLGDLSALNSSTGRTGNAPPVVAMMDGWKGKMSVKLVLHFAPDDTSKKETAVGIDQLGYPIGTIARPRSGKFFMVVKFDPKVTDLKGTGSPDGSSYSFTVPAYMGWSQSKMDDIVKRGN